MKFDDFKYGMIVIARDGCMMYVSEQMSDSFIVTKYPTEPANHGIHWARSEFIASPQLENAYTEFKPAAPLANNSPLEVRCKHCSRRVFENDAACWNCETKNPGRP